MSVGAGSLPSEDSPEVPGALTCRGVKEGVAAPLHRSWSSREELQESTSAGRQPPAGVGQNPKYEGWGEEEGRWRLEVRQSGSPFPSSCYPPPTLGYPASLRQMEGGLLEKGGAKTTVPTR